jgi:hypothetical protein
MHVNNVSMGRWTDASDDGIACLKHYFWSQGHHDRSTDPDFTVDVAVPSSWTVVVDVDRRDVQLISGRV